MGKVKQIQIVKKVDIYLNVFFCFTSYKIINIYYMLLLIIRGKLLLKVN